MKILIVGHSYVKYLRELAWKESFTKSNGSVVHLDYQFLFYPGEDFHQFISIADRFETVSEIDPDLVVTVFGGNSITNYRSNNEIKDNAFRFFQRLRGVVRPDCLILATQIEARHLPYGNRHDVPQFDEFNRRRQNINNFMNKEIKWNGFIDHMILLGSIKFINNPDNYRDGVHLNVQGMSTYRQVIENCILYALQK